MLKEISVIEDWLMHGQQNARREGKLSMLQIILAQKPGALSPELSSKLYQLTTEQLDRLGAALLNINSPQELQAWLNNGAVQESH